MTDMFPPTVQRPQILAFAEAADIRSDALRRDECGDWRISGQHGCVYAVPEGFQLLVDRPSVRAWSGAKGVLSFCTVTQDGDTGGSLMLLGRLPTPEEGEIIRKTLGIFKRIHLSDNQLENLRQHATKYAFQAVKPALDATPLWQGTRHHLEGPAA